jgi:histidyl-tRNA synthetase
MTAVLGPAGRGLRSQLRYASSIDATHAIILGDRELTNGTVVVRDLAKSEQQEVSQDNVVKLLAAQSS